MKLKVKLKEKDLFRFSMYHIYHGKIGRLSLIAGLFAVAFILLRWAQFGLVERLILSACVFIFFFWEPVKAWVKARLQAQRDVNGAPLDYEFTKDFIVVSQGRGRQKVEWNQVVKTVKTASLYIIYISADHAFLLPAAVVADKAGRLEEILREHVPAEQRKGF